MMSNTGTTVNLVRKVVIDVVLIFGLTLCNLVVKSILVPYQRGFFCGDQSLMYPFRNDTVTATTLNTVGIMLPAIGFLLCEWVALRSVSDEVRCLGVRIAAWLRGYYCVLVSFFFGLCFCELTTNVIKIVIGRLRPYFLEVCKPSVNCAMAEWQNRYIHPHEFHCTGELTDKFRNIRMSFVSGHSSWAAYTMCYLAIYLNYRITWQGARSLRHVLSFAVMMLSVLTALTRVSDYRHHWSDVVAGYLLGVVFAVLIWNCGTDLVEKKKDTDIPQDDIPFTVNKQVST